MDLRSVAVEEAAFLHLRDASENLMYEPDAEGKPDESKPVGITMYGPGSKAYARASAAKNNRLIDRMRKKGKADATAEENAAENAQFLAACTSAFHYIERDGLTGEALFKAVYSDTSLGFVTEQAAKFLGEWGNFSRSSAKS